MDWLTYTNRIAQMEVLLSPRRIVRGESSGLKVERVLDGMIGGFRVTPGLGDMVWLSDGSSVNVATDEHYPRSDDPEAA